MNGLSLRPGAPSSKQTRLHCPYFHHFALGRGEQDRSWLQASMRGLVLQENHGPLHCSAWPLCQGQLARPGGPLPNTLLPASFCAGHFCCFPCPQYQQEGKVGCGAHPAPSSGQVLPGRSHTVPSGFAETAAVQGAGPGAQRGQRVGRSWPCDQRPSPEPPSLSFSFSSYKMGL